MVSRDWRTVKPRKVGSTRARLTGNLCLWESSRKESHRLPRLKKPETIRPRRLTPTGSQAHTQRQISRIRDQSRERDEKMTTLRAQCSIKTEWQARQPGKADQPRRRDEGIQLKMGSGQRRKKMTSRSADSPAVPISSFSFLHDDDDRIGPQRPLIPCVITFHYGFAPGSNRQGRSST